MCEFSAIVAFNKVTNGQTDVKHEKGKQKQPSWMSLLKIAVEKLPHSQRSGASTYLVSAFPGSFNFIFPKFLQSSSVECGLSCESKFWLVVGIHFVSPWYGPSRLTGRKHQVSIYLPLFFWEDCGSGDLWISAHETSLSAYDLVYVWATSPLIGYFGCLLFTSLLFLKSALYDGVLPVFSNRKGDSVDLNSDSS